MRSPSPLGRRVCTARGVRLSPQDPQRRRTCRRRARFEPRFYFIGAGGYCPPPARSRLGGRRASRAHPLPAMLSIACRWWPCRTGCCRSCCSGRCAGCGSTRAGGQHPATGSDETLVADDVPWIHMGVVAREEPVEDDDLRLQHLRLLLQVAVHQLTEEGPGPSDVPG